MGESGAKPRVGLLPANPCQTGWLTGTSSSRDDCGATRGWNGRAVAERVERTAWRKTTAGAPNELTSDFPSLSSYILPRSHWPQKCLRISLST